MFELYGDLLLKITYQQIGDLSWLYYTYQSPTDLQLCYRAKSHWRRQLTHLVSKIIFIGNVHNIHTSKTKSMSE